MRQMLSAVSLLIGLHAAMPAVAANAISISPGAVAGVSVEVKNTRGYPWCEIIPIVGQGAEAVAEVYNSTSVELCPKEKSQLLDAKKLAEQLKLGHVAINPERFWIADEIRFYKAGEIVDFGPVKAIWVARMNADALKAGLMSGFFTAQTIQRDTQWLYKKGKPVYLLRAPEGKVWVMQVYGHQIDPGLKPENLDQLGAKLKLPAGWTFETKTLAADLSIEPGRAGGIAHILRDNLTNTYQGCGYDASCNYVP